MPARANVRKTPTRGFVVGIIALVVANAAFIPVQALLFPDAGGFTRTILYVRPHDPLPGYFIIVDEVRPNLPWEKAEVVFHGYGSLIINEGIPVNGAGHAFWQDGGVSLNLTLLSGAGMTRIYSGGSYHHGINDTLSYVKIRPFEAGHAFIVSLLIPNNGSYSWPAVSVSDTENRLIAQIGARDFLFVNKREGDAMANGILSTNAQILFSRANATVPGVEYAVMKDGTYCTVNGAYVMVSPTITTTAYVNGTGEVTPSSLFDYITPVEPSIAFARDLAGVSHPYLLVNDTGLPALRARCNGTTPGPWQGWYSYLNTTAKSLLGISPADFNGAQAANLAFVGYVDNNATYLTKVSEVLKTLDARQTSYRQLIDRGDDVLDFALAYDLTYSSLSSADQQEITTKLANLAAPLYDQMYIAPKNNWRIVMAGGLGMAGLALNNLAYIARAQEQVDFYHRECVRGNGACFEGQSYMRYALEMGLRFALALRQLGGYNYFANPRVLSGLNFSLYSAAPDGSAPLYEDCTGTTLAQQAIWSCNYVPDAQFAGQLKWYADRNNQGGYEPYSICAYATEITPIALDPVPTSVAYGDDDYAFLRSGWDTNATYLSLSNKDYAQSHVHYDENSIELWAYGKKLLANGGYPSYKKPGHAWALSTEAQNTVLIGGRGQSEQRSNGLDPAILTEQVDLVSGDAYLCYQHPFSFTAVPAFLVAYVALMALGIAILVGVKRMESLIPEKLPVINAKVREQPYLTETAKTPSPAITTSSILKGTLFPPTFDYGILASPSIKRTSRIAYLLATGSVILLLEGAVIVLISVLAPFIAEYTSSGNYTSLINIYNLALIIVPILLVGAGFLATWNSFTTRFKVLRSLIWLQDEAQSRNLKNLLRVSSIYSVFIVAVALAFLAWGIAPMVDTMFNDAFIQGGEVHVVIQHFIGFVQQCVILVPVIFLTQLLLRLWQANFLANGLQSEVLLANARVQPYRHALIISMLVALTLWIFALTIILAGNLGIIGFLDTLTIESI